MRITLAALFGILLPSFALAGDINVNGTPRTYILDQAHTNSSAPLIVALHGGGGSAKEFKRDSGLTPLANAVGVSVVYPESVTRQWNDGRTHANNAKIDGVDDLGFITALVKDLVAKGIADPHRIIITGISNGGMLSFSLACKTDLSIYAIVPVSANVDAGLDCSHSNARLINVVGTADQAVPMAGGPVLFGWGQGAVQSSAASFNMFLKANHCTGTSSKALPDTVDDGMTSQAVMGTGCAQSPVAQILVNGGGHGWAGGRQRLMHLLGAPTRDFSASQIVVDLALGKTDF